jgi:hypothetical protein
VKRKFSSLSLSVLFLLRVKQQGWALAEREGFRVKCLVFWGSALAELRKCKPNVCVCVCVCVCFAGVVGFRV